MHKILAKLINMHYLGLGLILLTFLIFNIPDADAYIMKHKNDYNSIDRIRSCQIATLPNNAKLPRDQEQGNQRQISIIKRDDLIKFQSIFHPTRGLIARLFIDNIENFFTTPPSDKEIASLMLVTFPPTSIIGIASLATIRSAKSIGPLYNAALEFRKSDYHFDPYNSKCAGKLTTLYTALKVSMGSIRSNCEVISPTVTPNPNPINDFKIMIKGLKKFNKKGCKLAYGSMIRNFLAYFGAELATAGVANSIMEKARLCGHNWTSWDPETREKNQTGLYQRKLDLCVKCRLGIMSPTFCPAGKAEYRELCHDNQGHIYEEWKGRSLSELLKFRKYREYIYRGVEREDHNDIGFTTIPSIELVNQAIARAGEDMKHCIDPTKNYVRSEGDIIKAYYIDDGNGNYRFYDRDGQYNRDGEVAGGLNVLDPFAVQKYYYRGSNVLGPFAVQKYYYRGTNSPKFNCKKYLQEPKIGIGGSNESQIELMRSIHRDAYDCCMKRKRGSICVEYSDGEITGNENNELVEIEGGDYYVMPYGQLDNEEKENIKEPVLNAHYRICNAEDVCSFGPASPPNFIIPLEFDSEYVTTDGRQEDGGGTTLLCAHTTSLCPFDMNIGGGTVICDNAKYHDLTLKNEDKGDDKCSAEEFLDQEDYCVEKRFAGKCKNYCQMLKHCVVVDGSRDYSEVSINSPYFDNSCFDFKGVSKYQGGSSSWGIDLAPKEIIRLTSPIAQCFRETLKNIFLNKAGHTKCLAGNNLGNYNTCPGGEYKWQKGQDLKAVTNDDGKAVYFSFFEFLQSKLYGIVQIFLILYVMIFGMRILMADKIMPRDQIIVTCLKIGFVLFFATGKAWQNFFFDAIYYASTTLGNIILDLNLSDLRMDGNSIENQAHKRCYFDPSTYPNHMQYVAIWDSIYCKLSQYLGLGPGITIGNLGILIVSGFFTGAYGVYFASLLLTFAAIFFSIIYLTLYIFVVSSSVIIILIFISPLIMVAFLFQATKSAFEQWVRQLMESATQIIILFSFISMVIFIFDHFFIGSASFNGDEPNCECTCKAPKAMLDEDDIDKHLIEGGIKKCGKISGTIIDDTAKTGAVTGAVAGAVAGSSFGVTGLAAGAAAGAAVGAAGGTIGGAAIEESTRLNCTTGNEDNRVKVDCSTIYREGLCEKKEGFKIKDPKGDSLLCIMHSRSVQRSSNLAIFGLTVPVLNVLLAPERIITLISTLIKIVLVTYILYIMTGRIVNISALLWSTKGLPDSMLKPIDALSKLTGGAKMIANVQTAGSKALGKKGREAGEKLAKRMESDKKDPSGSA